MNNLKKIITEVLEKYNIKKDCGCGCNGGCGRKKSPILNENLTAGNYILSENLQYHVNNKLPLTENTFRYGSKSFLNLWAEARKLYSRGLLEVYGSDKEIILETNLGEFGIFEGQKVPLDLPMIEEKIEGADRDLVLSVIQRLKSQGKLDSDAERTILSYMNHPSGNREGALSILKILDDKGEINEAEYKGKDVQLSKPKRGGSKKFYVYVKDPKTKKVKKVSFGAAGGGQNLAVKIRDPKARRAFAARQKCGKGELKTSAKYWACRLPRYAKTLGLKGTYSGFW